MSETQITKPTIIQIIPLPEGWWHEQERYNRVPALALVEFDYRLGPNDEWHKGREVLPLNEDLTVNWPAPHTDLMYATHPLGDNHDFIHHHVEHPADQYA